MTQRHGAFESGAKCSKWVAWPRVLQPGRFDATGKLKRFKFVGSLGPGHLSQSSASDSDSLAGPPRSNTMPTTLRCVMLLLRDVPR